MSQIDITECLCERAEQLPYTKLGLWLVSNAGLHEEVLMK